LKELLVGSVERRKHARQAKYLRRMVFFVQLRLEFCQFYTSRIVIFNCLQWLWASRCQTTTITSRFIQCLCSKTVIKLLQVLISPYSGRPTSLCFNYLLAVFAEYNRHNNGDTSVLNASVQRPM